jgi:hypothetical protein
MYEFLKPFTSEQLKYLRPIMCKNLGYDELISIFREAGILVSWPFPFDEALESWGQLC